MCGSRIVLPDMSQKMLAFSPPRSGHGTTSAVRMSLMNFVLARAFAKKRVAVATQSDEDLLEEILARRQRLARWNLENHSIHVHVAGEIKIHAAAFDLRPRMHLVRHHIKD